jgi:hypothetical protein
MLELQDEIRTNSQVRVQDEINLQNQKRGRLIQVEWKWSNGLSRDNLKHKFYTTRNLWEEAPLPFLYYILCLSTGATSKCHFSIGLTNGSPKTRALTISKFWTFISFSNIYIYIYISVRKLTYSS